MAQQALTKEQEFQYKLQAFGYDSCRRRIKLTEDLLKISDYLEELNIPSNDYIKNFSINRKSLFKYAKNYMDSNFKLHDIPILTVERMQNIVSKFNGNVIDLVEKINSAAKKQSPFNLPVHFIEGHSMIGELNKIVPIIPNDEYLKKINIVFSNINIGNNLTLLSSATYIHEITHTQLESIKGSVKNYFNKEVISIFMEKVVAFEYTDSKDLLYKSELMRFRHLLDEINELKNAGMYTKIELIEMSVYVNSTLKALKLFDIYMFAEQELRKEILDNIQIIFDGKMTVEDLLEKFDVTLENSCDIDLIKRHV